MAGAGRRGILQLPRRADQRPRAQRPSATSAWIYGDARFGGEASRTGRNGTRMGNWRAIASPDPVSFTPGPATASPSNTRGGSRMRESRPYGSVRGARSNARPYRDSCARNDGFASATDLAGSRGPLASHQAPAVVTLPEWSLLAPSRRREYDRKRKPGDHHRRAADGSSERKDALAGEGAHRELGRKQRRARLHDKADDDERPRQVGCDRACAAIASAAAACNRRNCALEASSPPLACTPKAASPTPAAPMSAATPARMRGERVICGSVIRISQATQAMALVKTRRTLEWVN